MNKKIKTSKIVPIQPREYLQSKIFRITVRDPKNVKGEELSLKNALDEIVAHKVTIFGEVNANMSVIDFILQIAKHSLNDL